MPVLNLRPSITPLSKIGSTHEAALAYHSRISFQFLGLSDGAEMVTGVVGSA